MRADGYRIEWVTLPGPAPCLGCGLGRIETGRRALRIPKAPSSISRVVGQWFHGFECLARRAEQAAMEEEDRGSGRGEPYRDLAMWARAQERARRAVP